MKSLIASLAIAGLILSPSAVLAQNLGALNPDLNFTSVDTDRNGSISWAEFSLIFTDYNEEQFNTADLNGDGELSPDEFDSLVLATGSVSSDSGAALPGTGIAKSLTDTSSE